MKVIAKCLAKLTTHFLFLLSFLCSFMVPPALPALCRGEKGVSLLPVLLSGGGDFKGNETRPPHWSTRIEAAAAANASQQAREDGDFPTEDGEFFL